MQTNYAQSHGGFKLTHDIAHDLESMHSYLMRNKIPYSHVSVVCDIGGYGCFFNSASKDLVTADMRDHMSDKGFRYVLV